MDAFCNYCGAKLDVENDSCCSQCGAPFDDNESVKQYRAEKRRREEQQRNLEEMRLRQQQQSQYYQSRLNVRQNRSSQQNNNINRTMKLVRIIVLAVFLGPVLLSILAGVFGAVNKVVNEFNDDDEYTTRKPITTFASTSDIVHENVEVSFNETAELDEYSFICDEVYRTEIKYGGADKGYMYVVFHIKVKNTSDTKIWLNNEINCIYDGDISCDKAWGLEEKSFNTYASLSAGLGTDGYICYIVPEKADSVVIAYGDYIRANIDLRNIEDRRAQSDTESEA